MARPRNPVEGSPTGERKRRVPMSGPRNILNAEGIPEGFVGRWVNDLDNRIQRAEEAGYDFVSKDLDVSVGDRTVESSDGVDSRISKIVGTDRVTGEPIRAYLMMQKKEWYEEDRAERQKLVDQQEESMRQQHKKPGLYGKIQIE